MQKIFNVDEKIIFPLKTIEKQIKNYTIILAPEFPNWIVLDNDEFKLYKELKKNTIKNSLENYKTHFKYDDEKIIVIAQRLLNKVERSKFYENTPIIKEERIENIKKKVQINLTNNCNLRCSHCYLSAGKLDLKSLNFEKIKNTLIELTDVIGISEIVFSGGEPLMYPKLFDLLSFSKRLGHKNILFTNGILITKDTIEILKNSVEEIQLSMEGISKKNYEFIRGKNTYDSFLETLLFLKEQQFPVSLAITAIDSVLDDIENNLVAFIQKINYENLNIRITDELEQSGNAKDFPKEYFELNYDRKTRINKVIYDLKFNGFNIDFNNNRNIKFSNCGIGTNIVVNYDGKIYPCNEFSFDYGNREQNLKKLINNFNDLNKNTELEKMEICNNCELKYLCNGGCRIKNKVSTGDYLIPMCDSIKKEKIYYNLLLDYYMGE